MGGMYCSLRFFVRRGSAIGLVSGWISVDNERARRGERRAARRFARSVLSWCLHVHGGLPAGAVGLAGAAAAALALRRDLETRAPGRKRRGHRGRALSGEIARTPGGEGGPSVGVNSARGAGHHGYALPCVSGGSDGRGTLSVVPAATFGGAGIRIVFVHVSLI